MPLKATIAAFGYADLDPEAVLARYAAAGCRVCQVTRNPEAAFDIQAAGRVCSDAGLEIDSLHGLFGPELDPSSPESVVRRRTVDLYKSEAEVALELGGGSVVVHPAPFDTSSRPALTDEARTERGAILRESLTELGEHGESVGVTYLIENLPTLARFGTDVLALSDVVRGLGSPRVRMCFDTGHAHLVAGRLGMSAASLLERCMDVVSYLHVHDNNGLTDQHQMPGQGTIEWRQIGVVMQRMGEDVPAALEVFLTPEKLDATDLQVVDRLYRGEV